MEWHEGLWCVPVGGRPSDPFVDPVLRFGLRTKVSNGREIACGLSEGVYSFYTKHAPAGGLAGHCLDLVLEGVELFL